MVCLGPHSASSSKEASVMQTIMGQRGFENIPFRMIFKRSISALQRYKKRDIKVKRLMLFLAARSKQEQINYSSID